MPAEYELFGPKSLDTNHQRMLPSAEPWKEARNEKPAANDFSMMGEEEKEPARESARAAQDIGSPLLELSPKSPTVTTAADLGLCYGSKVRKVLPSSRELEEVWLMTDKVVQGWGT